MITHCETKRTHFSPPPPYDGAMFTARIEETVRKRNLQAMSPGRVVVVAVKAEKVISKTALAWALTHVVHPGDCITLIALYTDEKTGRKLWSFPKFSVDCGTKHRKMLPNQIDQIAESCSRMVLQFPDRIEVKVSIKVIPSTPRGSVAAEAKRNLANWVILDKNLKQELKHCMDELRCNVVAMKGSQAKVLRLDLGCSNELQTPSFSAASSPASENRFLQGDRMKHSTPVSSPEEPCTSYTRTTEEVSESSYDTVAAPFLVYDENPLFEGLNKGKYASIGEKVLAVDKESHIPLSTMIKSPVKGEDQSVFWIHQNHNSNEKALVTRTYITDQKVKSETTRNIIQNCVQIDQDQRSLGLPHTQTNQRNYIINSDIRDAVSLGRTSSMPPPLCSLCQHNAPMFGKPPRRFSYEELEEATDQFSAMNFLAEGGFGLVHRGVLRDGQVVAVKQLKFTGPQGDADFCREVRVLSCAQHRNVVLLIGFCIEGNQRVLIYEYVCNGSLDFHLHETDECPLDWNSRLKIAIGAARGLRYLHEDCRVGCIVHRDMRPSNILLTHDFEPLVGDFGLARWHSEWDMSSEERIVGTSGYLAPEYFQGVSITHKVDVYAFGLVLLELMTGQRTTELQIYKGEHFLSEWYHLLAALDPNHSLTKNQQLLDPFLVSVQLNGFPPHLQAMGRAASLCLLKDPESRPSMSKILGILEGGDSSITIALDVNSVGTRSGRMSGLSSRMQVQPRITHSRNYSH